MAPDFQIIGGGLIGLSTAYALQERGASVRVIEARSGVARGTSYANAAMVHASLADPWNGPGVGRQLLASLINPASPMKMHLSALPGLMGWGIKFLRHSAPSKHWHATRLNYALAVSSMHHIEKWREQLNIDDDYQGPGMLKVFRIKADAATAHLMADKLKTLGLKAEYLSGAEAAAVEPCLAPIADKLEGAIHYPDDYKADAYKFCSALEREIVRGGGEIKTGIKARSFIRQRGQVIGINTDQGDQLASTTIAAAGARTYQLLKPLGINLALRPVKGYSLSFDGVSGPKLPVGDMSLHAAITPLGDTLRIAGTAEINGFNASLPAVRLKTLLGMLRDIYPELAQNLSLADGTPWCGFRPVSADGLPFIGEALPGLAVNTGQAHMGWTLSAGSGCLLADIMLGEAPELDKTVFAPNRP